MNIVLSSLVALLGVALLIKATRDRLKTDHARHWPTAQGKVLDSRLREVYNSDGKTWAVYILYEYWVKGDNYRSDVWRLEAGSSSFTGAAEKVIARYPIGSSVTVYYNPDAPHDAILEPGRMGWWLFFGGAAFFMVGIAGLIRSLG